MVGLPGAMKAIAADLAGSPEANGSTESAVDYLFRGADRIEELEKELAGYKKVLDREKADHRATRAKMAGRIRQLTREKDIK